MPEPATLPAPQTTAAPCVYGVPLEPGERVIYFVRDDVGWEKPALIVVGVLTLFAFIGIFFLAAGLMASTSIYIVTTRRFLVVSGKGGKKVEAVRHGEVKDFRKVFKGNQLRSVFVGDGKTQLSYLPSANPERMPSTFEGWIKDPASVEAAREVPFDADTLPRKPRGMFTLPR